MDQEISAAVLAIAFLGLHGNLPLMMILGHAVIGIKALQLVRLKFPVRWVLLGTLLPDLIDKGLFYALSWSLGREALAGTFLSGSKGLGHSALLLLTLILGSVFTGSRATNAVAAGVVTHLALDLLGDPVELMNHGNTAQAFLFPFLTQDFPPAISTGIQGHLRQKLHFGYVMIGELIGLAILAWDIWHWRKRRLDSSKLLKEVI